MIFIGLGVIALCVMGFVYASMYFSGQSDRFFDGATRYTAINKILNENCYETYPGIVNTLKGFLKEEDNGGEIIRQMAFALLIWNILFIVGFIILFVHLLRESSSQRNFQAFEDKF
jgi:hypothetical protein